MIFSQGTGCQELLSAPTRKENNMATNPPTGDGHRNGQVTGRSQVFNPVTNTFVKRDTSTGQFMAHKADGTPFKGVRKEK